MMFDLSIADVVVVIGTFAALFWLFRWRRTPPKKPDASQQPKPRTRSDSGESDADGDGGD